MVVLPIAAAILTEYFSLRIVPSAVLFFGLPAAYLSFRKPKIIGKSVIFSLIAMLGISWLFAYMIYKDNGWYVGSAFRLMRGVISADEIIWGGLWAYFGVIFWEYFLDHDKNKVKFSPKIRYLIILMGIQLVVFFSLYFLDSPWLTQPFFYLKFGLVILIPMVILAIFKFPRLIRKLLAIGTYFFFISVLVEYVGLRQGHWLFLGKNYIGSIKLAGETLPFEEIFFWIILGVPGLICWYEIFADDRR